MYSLPTSGHHTARPLPPRGVHHTTKACVCVATFSNSSNLLPSSLLFWPLPLFYTALGNEAFVREHQMKQSR